MKFFKGKNQLAEDEAAKLTEIGQKIKAYKADRKSVDTP